MNPRAIRFVIAPAVLFCAVQAALAGLVMQFEHTSQPGKPATSGSVYAETDRLRTELGTSVMIFRADKDLLWILDEKNARCTEMTREQMKALGEQARGAMAQMQEQMKDLPPAQRAMMEKMMGGKMQGTAAEPETARTIVKVGKTETINGFPCTLYEARRGDKHLQDLWVTDWKTLDIKPSDFKVYESFAEFLKSAMGPLVQKADVGFAQKYEGPDAVPGMPIRIVTVTEMHPVTVEVKKIAHETIAADKFEVPAGFKKEAMEIEGGRGQGPK